MDICQDSPKKIYIKAVCMTTMIDHCHRKLSGPYLSEESKEKKAFGILAGKKKDSGIKVEICFPLKKNARSQSPYTDYFDKIMAEHAVPSETPYDQRGWVADPEEMSNIVIECQRKKITIIGSYHMHRVSWSHDVLRDSPTALDEVLGGKSRMMMFIVSMVNPDQPVVRAFYEGKRKNEFPIAITR